MNKLRHAHPTTRALCFMYTSRCLPSIRRKFSTDAVELHPDTPLTTNSQASIERVSQPTAFNELDVPENIPENRYNSFAYLLRCSNFMEMGNPKGKIVAGIVVRDVDDDLYIDFGWKFYCVCHKPEKNKHLFVTGTVVYCVIKQLELSTKFLGATKDISLCEASCTLLGYEQDTPLQASLHHLYSNKQNSKMPDKL